MGKQSGLLPLFGAWLAAGWRSGQGGHCSGWEGAQGGASSGQQRRVTGQPCSLEVLGRGWTGRVQIPQPANQWACGDNHH